MKTKCLVQLNYVQDSTSGFDLFHLTFFNRADYEQDDGIPKYTEYKEEELLELIRDYILRTRRWIENTEGQLRNIQQLDYMVIELISYETEE